MAARRASEGRVQSQGPPSLALQAVIILFALVSIWESSIRRAGIGSGKGNGMRRIIVLVSLMMLSTAYGQMLPPPPSNPEPPANHAGKQPLNMVITPYAQPPVIQQASNLNGFVKSGDQVRVQRNTYIYSGPSEQAYKCGTLEGGASVVLLELPSPGAEFTAITSPENCYSLIPLSAVHNTLAAWVTMEDLKKKPQIIRRPVETLIDGDLLHGEYLSSGDTLPKGITVQILNGKKIKVNGKEETYCVIRSGGKEKRFVRTDDLEGVAAAAQAANSPLQNTGPQYGDNRAQQQYWQNHSSIQQTAMEGDQLPPQLAGQVQAAEQAYRTALHYGAWEDARLRYQHLLESDVLSVRILAKNRLEFISDWQRNPPTVTAAMSPQQNTALLPTYNSDLWIPGSAVVARPAPATSSSVPAPVKNVIIKPNQPMMPASNPAINVPTYSGPGTAVPNQQQQQPGSTGQATFQPQGQPVSRPATATAPAATASQKIKIAGKLNLAVYTKPNQLYYLTNSQGNMSYYVRSLAGSGIRLDAYLDKNIEVEGVVVQAMIYGQKKPQLNVVGVRLLQ